VSRLARVRAAVAALAAAGLLSACGGASMSEAASAAPAQGSAQSTAPTQASGMNFTAFTEQLLHTQSDSAQPLAVTVAQFVFPDNDNPQAFAAVLPAT
jgi:hypothetical protein